MSLFCLKYIKKTVAARFTQIYPKSTQIYTNITQIYPIPPHTSSEMYNTTIITYRLIVLIKLC